jgi:hypothetical protein
MEEFYPVHYHDGVSHRLEMNNQFNKMKFLDIETKLHHTGSIIFSITKENIKFVQP